MSVARKVDRADKKVSRPVAKRLGRSPFTAEARVHGSELPAGEAVVPPNTELHLEVTRQASELLDMLVATGLFGASREIAAERLICDGLLLHFPKAFASLGVRR